VTGILVLVITTFITRKRKKTA